MLERSKRGLIKEVVTVTGYEVECEQKGCPHVARFGGDYSRPSVELTLGSLGWMQEKKAPRWRCGACSQRLAVAELPMATGEADGSPVAAPLATEGGPRGVRKGSGD